MELVIDCVVKEVPLKEVTFKLRSEWWQGSSCTEVLGGRGNISGLEELEHRPWDRWGTEEFYVTVAGQEEEGRQLDMEVVCIPIILLSKCVFICLLSASFTRVSASENRDFAVASPWHSLYLEGSGAY